MTKNKVTFVTYDGETARNMLIADQMKGAIDCLYDEVFRSYIRGRIEVDEKTYKTIETIWKKTEEHFEGLISKT